MGDKGGGADKKVYKRKKDGRKKVLEERKRGWGNKTRLQKKNKQAVEEDREG